MCTVTIVPLTRRADGGRIRLACNRDESRTRPAALPPVVRRVGQRDAIMPIDPISDGTWIAANDAGLIATLLNVHPIERAPAAAAESRPSRGVLIPQLMNQTTMGEALAAAGQIDMRAFPPFRLLLVTEQEIAELFSDGATMRQNRKPIGARPHLFTSSGLGDAIVEGPRRALFDEMFGREPDWEAAQYAFHRHTWPDRRHLSVCMERAEARTVSHTQIDLEPGRVVLTYTPDAPGRAAPLPSLELLRAQVRS